MPPLSNAERQRLFRERRRDAAAAAATPAAVPDDVQHTSIITIPSAGGPQDMPVLSLKLDLDSGSPTGLILDRRDASLSP
jgi:hypothetical protein